MTMSSETPVPNNLIDQVADAAPAAALGGILIGHPDGPAFGVASLLITDVVTQRAALAALEDLATEED